MEGKKIITAPYRRRSGVNLARPTEMSQVKKSVVEAGVKNTSVVEADVKITSIIETDLSVVKAEVEDPSVVKAEVKDKNDSALGTINIKMEEAKENDPPFLGFGKFKISKRITILLNKNIEDIVGGTGIESDSDYILFTKLSTSHYKKKRKRKIFPKIECNIKPIANILNPLVRIAGPENLNYKKAKSSSESDNTFDNMKLLSQVSSEVTNTRVFGIKTDSDQSTSVDVVSGMETPRSSSTDSEQSEHSQRVLKRKGTPYPHVQSKKSYIDLLNPMYRKPFDFGWKRELVYRKGQELSTPKRMADVYYYTPTGKKVRSNREVSEYLEGFELTLDNFTFFKEPMGINDPNKEIIRDAKQNSVKDSSPPKAKNSPKGKSKKGAKMGDGSSSPGSQLSQGSSNSGPQPSIGSPNSGPQPSLGSPNSGSQPSLGSPNSGSQPSLGSLNSGSQPSLGFLNSGSQPLLKSPSFGLQPVFRSLTPSTRSSQMTLKTQAMQKQAFLKSHPQAVLVYPHVILKASPQIGLKASPQIGLKSSPPRSFKSSPPGSLKSSPPGSSNGFTGESPGRAPRNFPRIKVVSAKQLKAKVTRQKQPNKSDELEMGMLPPTWTSNDSFSSPRLNMKSVVISKKSADSSGNAASTILELSSSPSISKPLGNLATQAGSNSSMTNLFSYTSVGYTALMQVFEYLKVKELLRASRVCRMWRDLANDKSMWHTVRLKNAAIYDWSHCAAFLKEHSCRTLDMRKMLIYPEDEEGVEHMWHSFCLNIGLIDTLRRVEVCRCPAVIVERIAEACNNISSITALGIICETIDLTGFLDCKDAIEEIRLKSLNGISASEGLDHIFRLETLVHLSLTSFTNLGLEIGNGLGELVLLETLELGDCVNFPKDFGTKCLRKLTYLQKLRLEKGCQDFPLLNVMAAIKYLPSLAQFELINFDIGIGFMESLGLCTNLKQFLIIPTYLAKSANTNHLILSGIDKLKHSLTRFMWGITFELMAVTAVFIGTKEDNVPEEMKESTNNYIPVLKPSKEPNSFEGDYSNNYDDKYFERSLQGNRPRFDDSAPDVNIISITNLERKLNRLLPDTIVTILSLPFSATMHQTISEIPYQ